MYIVRRWLKNKTVRFIFLSFLLWRIGTELFLFLGPQTLPLERNFLGGGEKYYLENPGLWSWANFDGQRYLSIAQAGYQGFEQAFFPFYPRLINLFVPENGNNLYAYLVSGLAISHICLILALYLFYKLIRIDYEEKTARWSIVFLLVFPVSFVFGGTYTESLFLLLLIGSFYFARKGNWWLAGILGAMASATRIMGIFLLPALLTEWFEQHNNIKQTIKDPKKIISIIPVIFTSYGLLWYMNLLQARFNDPLKFLHSQTDFGAQRMVDRFILIYQVFWRYLRMALDTKIDPLFYTVWLELLIAISFLALIIIAAKKGIRHSYVVFAALAYLIPTLTGTFSSIPRYALVLFPCFIVLSLIKNQRIKYLWFSVNLVFLLISTILFTRGYFIG